MRWSNHAEILGQYPFCFIFSSSFVDLLNVSIKESTPDFKNALWSLKGALPVDSDAICK